MGESARILIEEGSQTAEARRSARKLAGEIGLDEIAAEQVAIVVTETCTNILNHAGRGELLLNAITEGHEPFASLEVLALDRGPGMSKLEQSMRDGYSTAGSAGQGLGAIVRLSNESDFYSLPGRGTAILARWRAGRGANGSPISHRQKLQIGVVNISKPGEAVCGDAWGSLETGAQFVTMVSDGLGHGMEARVASLEAVRTLRSNPELSPKALLDRSHQALRSTRGAAVAVARIDANRGKLTFAGIGNIAARIYSGAEGGQHLVSMNGTAGHHSERCQEFSYVWPQDGMLILHSDGLTTGASVDTYQGLAMRDPSLIAGVLYRDFTRGHDDSTVVVVKARQ